MAKTTEQDRAVDLINEMGWTVGITARYLGVHERTLYRWLNGHGVRRATQYRVTQGFRMLKQARDKMVRMFAA